MHELSIVQGIVGIALRRSAEIGAKKVKGIKVKVGEFTSVEPDCLRFYFDAVTKDSTAEGAELIIEQIPLVAECTACGSPFTPEGIRFTCPNCGSRQIELTAGRELYVESIEVE